MAAFVQKVSSYAVQLLAHLNLQRERAELCDCVVIQRLNPGRVFPAHRCVLSASSPVLASILSSTGALVELKDPCLSDSVLAMLLDYIYTGSMQCTQRKEQYYNLLTAATYLQMDELQDTLMALQQTNVDAADKTDGCTRADHHPYEDMKDADGTKMNSFSEHQPLSRTCIEKSMHKKDHTCAANVDTCNEIYSCRSSNENGTNCCSRKDNSSSKNASTICCLSGSCANSGNCTQVSCVTSQDLIDFPCTIETHGVFTEVLKSRSVGIAKSETCQENTMKKVVRTIVERRDLFLTCTAEQQEEETRREENTKEPCLAVKSNVKGEQMKGIEEDKNQIRRSPFPCLSTSTLKDNVSPSQCASSSPHPCCEAVSVICHSSTASMTQLAKLSTMPPSIPKASVSACSQSESTDIDNIVEGTTISPKDFNGAQNQDLCCKSNSSNIDHFTRQNSKHSGSAFPHIVNPIDQNAHVDSFQNQLKDLRGDLVPQKRLCRSPIRELTYKPDLSFEDFPSKQQRLDCSDSHNIPMATTAKGQSIHLHHQKDKVPLYVQETGAGCDCQCEHFSPEGEVKEEHTCSKRYPTNVEKQDGNSNLCGPKTDWYQTLQRAETSPEDIGDKGNIAMTDQINSVFCTSIPTTPELSLGNVSVSLPAFESSTSLENISNQIPVDNSTSDPTSSVMGQSYRAHLHYHCLPQEDTQISHRDSDRLYSSPLPSDQPRDDEEVGTFANPDYKTLRQHLASGITERVLLLDISTKPAELLVSYKHRSAVGENWAACDHKDTFASVFENNDREQWDEVPPAHVVDERTTTTRTNLRYESFDGAETKSWVGDANVAKRQSVGKDQSSLGAEVLHEAETVEVGSHAFNLTGCTPPTDPVFVQDSTSSTLSDSIPSTVSGIMPTNKSSPLSTPVRHLFQCYLCDRSFSQRGSLNRHVRSHLGVRPFHCPSCPLTFSRQYRVTEHMRVHQRCALGTDFQKLPASPT